MRTRQEAESELAQNPDIDLRTARTLWRQYPDLVAKNPALPLWALEDPMAFDAFARELRVRSWLFWLWQENRHGADDLEIIFLSMGQHSRDWLPLTDCAGMMNIRASVDVPHWSAFGPSGEYVMDLFDLDSIECEGLRGGAENDLSHRNLNDGMWQGGWETGYGGTNDRHRGLPEI